MKYSFIKVYLNLTKDYTSIILSFIKSFIKFTNYLLIYYNFFIFNAVIKNKKTILEYYKKKIIANLFKTIYLLTLNTCKAIITDLELDL